ncbi:radical SAM/SPASM domain-containing protein [Staphylococcus felis]|uniref:radical SAM/SPASM domain-containing protein n=1 Tax=Staphylococcus felis TaxID=46127 RepID=UPI000E26E01D|nr:radical SAM protein [Staphylococcus felis]REH79068.1 radical SAM/SPASM domain-containing protein [Staphylococcus felis]REI29076.1 radical SAM/SPASM domain-containing protein [Staphylococcus felis]
MNLTFWITEDCNLRCKYCYVSKTAKYFDTKNIDITFQFITQLIETSSEKFLNVNFHGGEPTLNFSLIEGIVDKFKILKKQFDLNIRYYITTNGTIMNKTILNFMIENNFNISLSVDGTKDIHDANRIYSNGMGSFDNTMGTLNLFKERNYHIRIRMTITPQTVNNLFNNYKYFYEMGYLGITAIPDTTTSEWDQASVKKYEIEMNKISKYLYNKSEIDFNNHIHNLSICVFKKLEVCDGGINTFHISAHGDIYPCALVVGQKKFNIGNVNDGLKYYKIKGFSKEYSINNQQCQKCSLMQFCEGNRCKYINYASTGSFHKPSQSYCSLHRKQFFIVKSAKEKYENQV